MTFMLRSILVFFLTVSMTYAQGPASSSWDDIVGDLLKIVLMLGLSWLVRHGMISHEIEQGMNSAAQRAKDKYVERLVAARDPNSDGGVEVTDAEKSEARAEAYKYLLGGLGGAAKSLVEQRGPDWAKGLLGAKLDAKLIEAGIDTARGKSGESA